LFEIIHMLFKIAQGKDDYFIILWIL
jgi:hypothetical protein